MVRRPLLATVASVFLLACVSAADLSMFLNEALSGASGLNDLSCF